MLNELFRYTNYISVPLCFLIFDLSYVTTSCMANSWYVPFKEL